MNSIRRCRNNCIFCFVDQMPPGLRPTLYIKDDDYLQSFIYGNFITLTNMTEKDIEKIIKHRIEPLHISMHSMNHDIRKRIFRKTSHLKGLKYLRVLDESGVKTNIQIVLLPGINDSEDLENTVLELTGKYKNIESIGIVPVGITKYNENRELKAVDDISAIKIIKLLERLKKIYGKKISRKVFLSDEFYLISNTSIPSYRSYGKFWQINNGIGKSADFLNDIKKYTMKRAKKAAQTKRSTEKILLITSEYGSRVLKEAIQIISGSINMDNILIYDGISMDTLEIKNTFFGGNVKVTGLLTGADIKKNLSPEIGNRYSSVLIPGSIFNDDGLTLDGYTQDEIVLFGENVKIIPEDGLSLMNEIENYFLKNQGLLI